MLAFGLVAAHADEQPQRATVAGRVLSEPGGRGVADVVVTLWSGSGGGRRTARTDASGSYAFPAVEPGDYYKVSIQYKPEEESSVWSEDVVLKVAAIDVRAGDLFVRLPQSLSGTVTDVDTGLPVAGAGIVFSTDGDGNAASVVTDSEGRYRLFVRPRAIDLHCTGTRDRYYGAAWRARVRVAAGTNVSDCNFNLKSAPPFVGTVALPDGSPPGIPEVLVEVRWLNNRLGGGDTDAGGTGLDFRVKTDEAGRFIGYMRRPRERDWKETIDLTAIARLADGTLGGVARVKTDTEQKQAPRLNVVFARPASVKVRVVNPEGKHVADAQLTTCNYWRAEFAEGSVTHLGEGTYQITGLTPGLDYGLRVQAPDCRINSLMRRFVLEPDETRHIGIVRLEWGGPRAIPGLLEKLQSPDMYARQGAASQLGRLAAVEAVPALIEKLKNDPSNSVRFSAAAALGRIGPAAQSAVPALIRALKEDEGGGVQREAATALGLIGDDSALPALTAAAHSPENDVRFAALESIKLLEKSPVPVPPIRDRVR